MSIDLAKELWDMANKMNESFIAQKVKNAVHAIRKETNNRREHQCEKGHIWVSDKDIDCPFCKMLEEKESAS